MSALNNQIGGEHYKGLHQPIQLITRLRLNFFQGNILKYPCRFKRKNGIEDLNKAIHYCQLGAELNPTNYAKFNRDTASHYVVTNALDDTFVDFIEQICNQNWLWCMEYINKIKDTEYGSK